MEQLADILGRKRSHWALNVLIRWLLFDVGLEFGGYSINDDNIDSIDSITSKRQLSSRFKIALIMFSAKFLL